MSATTVLKEILAWSIGRPAWQRDALKRLVNHGSLGEEDISELATLCKKAHGLAQGPSPVPLTERDLPSPDSISQSVSLRSLTHAAGVNALAPAQTIAFGPQLTIVYGENAAGKSGYTRILKRACRARGAEEILGNVTSPQGLGTPTATIDVDVDGEDRSFRWKDEDTPNRYLSRISVFDHHSASVYIARKTDVAFRPMGLDLFDKLSSACGAVKDILEGERRALTRPKLTLPGVPQDTEVGKLLSNLTSLTNPSEVETLAAQTSADIANAQDLEARFVDLRSRDRDRRARQIESQADRVRELLTRLRAVEEVTSEEFAGRIHAARRQLDSTTQALREHRAGTFSHQPLTGTGSTAWRALWSAARRFSEGDAYPERSFPVIGDKSRCVLCQEGLSDEGQERFRVFGDFFQSEARREHGNAKEAHAASMGQLRSGIEVAEAASELVRNLGYSRPPRLEKVHTWLQATLLYLAGLEEAGIGPVRRRVDSQPAEEAIGWTEQYVNELEERARELRMGEPGAAIARVEEQLREVKAREILRMHRDDVLQEIERRKKLAAYQECIADTRTHAITRRSTDVTKRAVTEQLKKAFQRELGALGFGNVEVQVAVAGGSRGALYHKLQLRRAPGVEVSKVVSEGEGRCLAIASFFAELETAGHRSTILFDDPVSSLDHLWREKIAKRLVQEARTRQVVVFTHDVGFLVDLAGAAEHGNVDVQKQMVQRDAVRVGVSSQEIPWVAMSVKRRIGQLRDLAQAASALYNQGRRNEYERDASGIYGKLRECWERGVEEVLLGGTVERFRHSIETNRAKKLHDITEDDIAALSAGMSKCSKWLPGHDLAPGAVSAFPDPEELEADIAALSRWVTAIRKRR